MSYLKIGAKAFLFAGLLFTVFPKLAQAHGGESRVEIELESPAQVSAGNVSVEFQLVDTEENTVLTPAELNVIHEKKIHFLAYDPALQEFRHEHPMFDGKVWKVDLSFAVNGNYFIWAQGELASDSEEFSALSRLKVTDGAPEWPAPALTDIRTGKDSVSVATLSNTKLKAGKMAMPTLTFSREDGSTPEITPFLGAFAHVIATPEDGDSLIHIHPMDSENPNEGMLHVTFPTAGYYRLWVQFMDAGILKTVPLSVQVNNKN